MTGQEDGSDGGGSHNRDDDDHDDDSHVADDFGPSVVKLHLHSVFKDSVTLLIAVAACTFSG